VVITTGSYEGSLPMEGISDHHEASTFTSRRSRWSWLSRAFSDPCTEAKSRRHGQVAALAKAREAEGDRGTATGMSEARSRQCRGNKKPTLMAPPQGKDHEDSHETSIRRSGPSDVVKTSGPPVSRTEPKTPWGVPVAKAASASRERARCGCT
jgi:hypothetical protein